MPVRHGRASGVRSCVALSAALALVLAGVPARARAQGPLVTQADPPPWSAPARAASRSNPLPSSAATIKQGQAVYKRDCELCHGVRGAGNGQLAPTLPTRAADLASRKVQAQSDGAMFWKIREGRGVMPTTQVTMTDDERWAVVTFLRTFAKRR